MQISKEMNKVFDEKQTIRLIQQYGENRLLWDTNHPQHLSAKMRKETWMKIASEYKLPVSVLKKKMVSLLSSHRRELHREKKSRVRAAATGTRHIYSSKWFGYPHFAFMRNKNNVKTRLTKPIDDGSVPLANENTKASLTESQHQHTTNEIEQVMIPTPRQSSANKRRSSEKSESEYEEEQDNNSLARSLLRNAFRINDPYISFGNYIASELRKYDPRTLACVKHAIHNIIFEADLCNIKVPTDHLAEQPSPSSSSFVLKFSPAASDASSG